MDLSRRTRMSHIELSYLVWSIIEVVQILPSVVFNPIALPLDQVLYFSMEQPTVQDCFDNLLFLVFDKFGRASGVQCLLEMESSGARVSFTTLKTGFSHLIKGGDGPTMLWTA